MIEPASAAKGFPAIEGKAEIKPLTAEILPVNFPTRGNRNKVRAQVIQARVARNATAKRQD
jgi:hypothetical protein